MGLGITSPPTSPQIIVYLLGRFSILKQPTKAIIPMQTDDPFLQAAIEEARRGLAEGGIPIGSVLVHKGHIIGRGHNRRVQQGSCVLHGEMDALENAGRQPASVYRECTIYTTLSPCSMCTGAILLYGIPRVVIGEHRTFMGEEDLLKSRGVEVRVVDDAACVQMMQDFIAQQPELWNEDIGE
jgi:creatinine deaminase